MVNETAALLNRPVTQVTPPHCSAAVYNWYKFVSNYPTGRFDENNFPKNSARSLFNWSIR
jgi:hypothetical protein